MAGAYGIFKAPILYFDIRELYRKYQKGTQNNVETALLATQIASTALNVISLFTNYVPQVKLVELGARVVSVPLYYLTENPISNKIEYAFESALGIFRISQESQMLKQCRLGSQSAPNSLYAAGIGELLCARHVPQQFFSWLFFSKKSQTKEKPTQPLSSNISSSPKTSSEIDALQMPSAPSIFSWPPLIKWCFWVPLDERTIVWRLSSQGTRLTHELPKNYKELCQLMKNLETLSYTPEFIECDASSSAELLTRCSISNDITSNPVMPKVLDQSSLAELPYYDRDAFLKWQKEHPTTPPPKWPENLVNYSSANTIVQSVKYSNTHHLEQIKKRFFDNSQKMLIALYKDSKTILMTPFFWNLLSGGTSIDNVTWLKNCSHSASICPLTLEPLLDPVQDPTSDSANAPIYYERQAILTALKYDEKSPMTRRKLTPEMLLECKDQVKKSLQSARFEKDVM